jgi:hypothetical protein
MAIAELMMPKLGESIMEATILKWHKKVGDYVKFDDVQNQTLAVNLLSGSLTFEQLVVQSFRSLLSLFHFYNFSSEANLQTLIGEV